MSEIKCPKCGSKRIDQYRMPIGAIWCSDCGFRVEQKERGNPFIVEQPKPAHVQSDVELARTIHEECYIDKSQSERSQLVWDASIAAKLIEADRAAQRQAGREEAMEECADRYTRDLRDAGDAYAKRYAAVVEAARKIRPWAEAFRDGYSIHESQEADAIYDIEAFDKALSDLDEAREG